MGRLCERPGCSEVAAIAYGFDVDQLLVWLAPRDPDAEPLRAGSLCRRHADAMVVPRGWTLDDRREARPRLFRSPPSDEPRARSRAKRTSATEPPADQLVLDSDERTVADVAGAHASDDPDATVAIPWMPDFDQQDDLDGVLDAHSPLLARAFRGTDRPR